MSKATGLASPTPKTIALAVGAALIGAIALFVAKTHQEEVSRQTLTSEYGAVIDIDPETRKLSVSIENDSLKSIEAVAPFLKKAGDVTFLDLSGCTGLTSTLGIGKLRHLEALIAYGLPSLVSLDEIDRLPRLRELAVGDCPKLSNISGVLRTTSLAAIDLSSSPALVGEIDLSELDRLTDLTLSRCENLDTITLGPKPQLRSLRVDGCSGLKSINQFSAPELTDIDLSNTYELASVAFLANLPALQLVDARNCTANDLFPTLAQCPSIRILRLGGQSDISDFSQLSSLVNLEEFHFDASASLKSLNGLPVAQLSYLGIPQCRELTDIGLLAEAKSLRQLDVSGCLKLADLSALADLPLLQEVNLTSCRAVRDIEVFKTTPSIAVIQLGGTSAPRTQIAELQKLLRETIIDLSGDSSSQLR